MAAVPVAELNKAIDMWLYIQATQPAWAADYINKLGGNPFVPWPPDKSRVDAFMRLATEQIFRGTEAEKVGKAIDPKKREELVEAFDREYEKAQATRAVTREKAKKRLQEVIAHTLEEPQVDPNQKELLFKTLASKSEREPDKTVLELVPEAIQVGEVAQAFARPIKEEDTRRALNFSNLKDLRPLQKAIAPLADAATAVFPELRAGAINIVVADSLDKLMKSTDKLTSIFGGNIVNNPAYDQWLTASKRMVAQGSTPGGAKTIVDDVFASLFRGGADQTVTRYTELYAIGGIHPSADFNQLRGASTGIGSSLFHMGLDIGADKVKGAAMRGILTKLGVGAAEAASGVGLPVLLFQAGLALLGKLGNWFKNLVAGKGKVRSDGWVFGGGCGAILLVFFILPIMSQLSIDSSLATRLPIAGGGPAVVNRFLDVSITANPASSVGNRPTAMRYDACVKPKGSPGSFKINSGSVKFSVFGGSGSPGLNEPTISPNSFSNGCFSFTVPFGPQLENSVVTATFDVNADVGTTLGVDGSATVSTVIGNPATGCFVFGEGGQPDAYGHTSSQWDSTAAITAAIGILSRSPVYMSKVCTGGTPITIYRVKADFGGGSASPPNKIFMYNACAVSHCATYTLAHETGHIVDARTGFFDQYNRLGLYAREGPLWTYPNGFSEHEDFAETLGAYVVWHDYLWGARHGHGGGTLEYGPNGPYKYHYEFAKEMFGGVEY